MRSPRNRSFGVVEALARRCAVFTDSTTIEAEDVARELDRRGGPPARSSGPSEPADPTLEGQRSAAEKAAIEDALAHCGGNRTQAARTLGISRRTLYNRLSELGIA